MRPDVRVTGVPIWVPAERLLGPEPWVRLEDGTLRAELSVHGAADVAARLRGVGLAGGLIEVECAPQLSRAVVRAARAEDARRRRDTTPGFSRGGARVDDEGRMSLTAEAVADEVAALSPPGEVWDLGCGVGGNAIAFARAGWNVIAVERDAGRLAMARHNAGLYGLADSIRWVCGDAVGFLREAPFEAATLLHLDPPWGAEWDRARTERRGFPLLQAAMDLRAGRRLWAKLPASFAPETLGEPAEMQAFFGHAPGDFRRVKFLLARMGG